MASVSTGKKDQLSLNLMPMLDVFSILITFLLMSYSTDPVNHDVSQGVELPDSKTILALDEMPAITVSKTELYVNDKKIANIVDSDVPQAELGESHQGAIRGVFDELKKVSEANKRLGNARNVNGGDPAQIGQSGILTMEMDKSHKFKLMKRIMLSAQQAEFVTFKLMVGRENN